MQKLNYKTEFPDYDDNLWLLEDWIDTSWHNDVCPSFEKNFGHLTYRVWCDYKAPERREMGGKQFSLVIQLIGEEDFVGLNEAGEFDSLVDLLNFFDEVTQ